MIFQSKRMIYLLKVAIVCFLVAAQFFMPCKLFAGGAITGTVKYTIGSWQVEGWGNRRARVKVEKRAGAKKVDAKKVHAKKVDAKKVDAVLAHIMWRRRDARPDEKEIIVVDAATGKRVNNIIRANINREFGDILFQPLTVPGIYYIYFMPYKTEGWWAFPTTRYLSPSNTSDPKWVKSCKSFLNKLSRGEPVNIPIASVIDIQAINNFNSMYPMEVIATSKETKQLVTRYKDRPFLIFPEDRRHSIRMTDDLPLRWIHSGPRDFFKGSCCRGEFYTFQLGLYAFDRKIEDVKIKFGSLTASKNKESSKAGKSNRGKNRMIPASAMCCFNLGGINWLGVPFHKTVDVGKGKIQPFWIGVQIPRDASAGTYKGVLTVGGKNEPPSRFNLTLEVLDKVLDDFGDGNIRNMSRLRWLDSTIGLDDEVFAPYTPVEIKGRTVSILGRQVHFTQLGLPDSIKSTFTSNVNGVDGPAREILSGPMEFIVQTASGSVQWKGDPPRILEHTSGAVTWEATSRAGSLELLCRAKMECDGYINFKLSLRSDRVIDLKDVCLEIPLDPSVAVYMMGMGRKGGRRPSEWRWKWDPSRANNQLWIGDVNAGLSLKLKHVVDRWDLYNLKQTGIYRDWGNKGKGGCKVSEEQNDGRDSVVIRAYSGPIRTASAGALHFNFGLLITPLKVLDKGHWKWRYFHKNPTKPVAEIAQTGATIINIHQGDGLNPYINYPFLTTAKLSNYVNEAHARDIKVKLYYTVRELSNYAVEFWALRSLGNEVYLDGPGFKLADHFLDKKHSGALPKTGSSWLCEHAVTGYVPAWHQPLGNGNCDAAIATTGLSRWHNYYLEGLRWLIKNIGIDGLYLDGVGYDREIMKRVRKVMQRTRPGCLIDFHSGNNFHPQYGLNSCANQYMELFPCIDSLWFGEGFNYNESPDYWLVEISGIPFGLFGEMLQGGGNPWRGMVYGMTNRLGWGGDPRGIWKIFDSFGIETADMMGYWDQASPVKTGRSDVLASVYVKKGKTLVALASWAAKPVACRFKIDFKALGLDSEKAVLYAPAIDGFQTETLFKPSGQIPVMPGKGWLFILDEKKRKLSLPADIFAGRKLLFADRFSRQNLGSGWTLFSSKRTGTSIKLVKNADASAGKGKGFDAGAGTGAAGGAGAGAAGGELQIRAAANSAVFVERKLPRGAALFSCRVYQGTDNGASWGPGMSLVWSNGKSLRVNIRDEDRFGVDDGSRQILKGFVFPGSCYYLVICLEEKKVTVLTSNNFRVWQTIATFPRSEFSGEPKTIRLGKMSPASENKDFSTPGPNGVCSIKDIEIFGPVLKE